MCLGLKRPIINLELKFARDVKFLTLNIVSDAPQKGVADSEKPEGVMHVTGMALGTPLHSAIADMPYCLIIVEVPSGRMEGIHSVLSRNAVSRTLDLLVGDVCDPKLNIPLCRCPGALLSLMAQWFSKFVRRLWDLSCSTLQTQRPTEASNVWFLVIIKSVHVACSLAVRMPLPISVVLGLPTKPESVAKVGAQMCSNLPIADGLNPILWYGVFESFENGYPMDCSYVPEKVETEHESDEELEMVGAIPEDAAYGTSKQSAPPHKKGGHTPREDTSKASQSQSNGKGNKKAKPTANADVMQQHPLLRHLVPRKPRLGVEGMEGLVQWH